MNKEPHWIFKEYWSEVLHKDRHFFMCSNCLKTYSIVTNVCPHCKKTMDSRIELSKK